MEIESITHAANILHKYLRDRTRVEDDTNEFRAMRFLFQAASVIGHCKDCKWWGPDQDRHSLPVNYGVCQKGEVDTRPLNGLCYEDDGGCYQLSTGPEFGCVNFERKCTCGYIEGNRITVYCMVHSRRPLTEAEKQRDVELKEELRKLRNSK